MIELHSGRNRAPEVLIGCSMSRAIDIRTRRFPNEVAVAASCSCPYPDPAFKSRDHLLHEPGQLMIGHGRYCNSWLTTPCLPVRTPAREGDGVRDVDRRVVGIPLALPVSRGELEHSSRARLGVRGVRVEARLAPSNGQRRILR